MATTEDTSALWQQYRRTRDRAVRDRLILTYAPLVKFVAGRLGSGLPAHVDEGDLVSYGLLGLIGAIERFDPDREIKFETYAISRIKGAIIDELRALDWVPRSVRARARDIERAIAELERKLHRAPTDEEIAAKLGLTEDELGDSLTEISRSSIAALDELWTEYKANETPDARERLILHYSPLVKFVAGRVAAGLPQNIDQADLVSYGIFGLIDAIDKFDPDRGFKFETYAISRIKGSIIDELRSIDWVPRSVRAKARSIERAYSKLENANKRTPDDGEIAGELDMTESELAQTLSQISFVGLVALDELMAVGGGGGERGSSTTVGEMITDGRHDPVKSFEIDEMKHLLADAINRMPDRERLVLTLYYYEGLTLSEIGEVLGVTESRICQIHTKAILQLRARLGEPERTDA